MENAQRALKQSKKDPVSLVTAYLENAQRALKLIDLEELSIEMPNLENAQRALKLKSIFSIAYSFILFGERPKGFETHIIVLALALKAKIWRTPKGL